jgi:hypothetical protein
LKIQNTPVARANTTTNKARRKITPCDYRAGTIYFICSHFAKPDIELGVDAWLMNLAVLGNYFNHSVGSG